MDIQNILYNFYQQFKLHPVIGIEFEFFSTISNFNKIKDCLYKENIILKKEQHPDQYEIVLNHTTNIILLIQTFNNIKEKIKTYIQYSKKKLLVVYI